MLFLTNEHVQAVLDMRTALNALEEAYFDLAEEHAGYRPRIDFYVPQEPHYYRWGTMEGASRKHSIFAIRMKSDMLVWEENGESRTEDKYCVQPGTYCGLILLVNTRTAEPLAMMNDGYVQHVRVGAAAGLGAKYLSRKNSRVLGIYGSGGMARTYAEAICAVRPIERIKVYSPTKDNREKYAAEIRKELGIEVEPVSKPELAARGADIVAMTTDSLIPVIKPEWLEPGMHVTNVRSNEVGLDVLARVDTIFRLGYATIVVDQHVPNTIGGGDGMFAYFAGTAEEKGRVPSVPAARAVDNSQVVTVPDVMAGKCAGRTSDKQITFLNNQGTQGLQFAAIGGAAYRLAKEKGLGHLIPQEWFLQNIRD